MARLKPTQDNRTTYDKKNGAVRSFFGTDLVEYPNAGVAAFSAKATSEKASDFLAANKDLFKLQNITVMAADRREGSATESLRYRQEHDGIPVYGAEFVVGMEKGGKVSSAVNGLDYDIPAELTRDRVRLTATEAAAEVSKQLGRTARTVLTAPGKLYVYRNQPAPRVVTPKPELAERATITGMGTGQLGQVYLAWLVPTDTRQPLGNWDVFVDALTGAIVAVRDRRHYAAVKAMVFRPDPISTSKNASLSSATPESILNPLRVEVALENLDPPVGDTFRLDGKWAASRELETPVVAPPTTTTHFKYGAKDRRFLSVMAYYWVDRVVTYLRGFGIPTYNHAVELTRINLDAQGLDLADQSHFTTDAHGHPYLAFGEGGVPDASDAHVVIHEYGHALHFYLGTSQNEEGNEEGYGDFLAGSWLDRVNVGQFQRESVFPWDNNASPADHYSKERFFNTPRKFSDADYDALDIHVKGSVLAATLWDLFLSLGGGEDAADAVNRLYVEMLLSTAANARVSDLAKGLVTADQALNGGTNKAKIKAAFGGRGLAL
jgi:zinc metalloprotease ZmpB